MPDEKGPQFGGLLPASLMHFCSGKPMHFCSGVDRADSYVLGEINVSSVFPIPDEAPAWIARRVADRLRPKF